MANLIKSALIKQLSKFLKNVSANQINISTFKGEGEIKNIQLDENVLMELLELPTWLNITNARCNKVAIKIQWTKLKTIPIMIGLDKIEVEMEITENLREYKTSKDSKLFDKDFTGPYGFIDRCIDGIQLNIDSISISIKSSKFNANLNMSNLLVYSTTPNWKLTSDIRNTRLKDLEKEEIIVFKEISWEICRLEAYNIEQVTSTQQQQQQPTSIKLIMNPSKVQVALKKKLSDKSLLNSTFRILLNEIYWMANDTQLKAAIGTYNTIAKLIKKSSLQKRKYMANQQQQQQQQTSVKQQDASKASQPTQASNNDLASKVFLQYDIKETSLHLNISILNIHLYADDNYSGNKLIDGGAMQVLFKDLCIDHYPYHKTGQSIKHWNSFNHVFSQREDWSKLLLDEFVTKLENILSKSNLTDINKIKLKNETSLLESCLIVTLKDLCVYKVSTNMSNKSATTFRQKRFSSDIKQEENVKTSPNDLLKSSEYFVHQQMFNKRQFFSTNSAEFNLPSDTLFAHFFLSEFYFPDDCNYPVPSSQIYSHISPILVNVDYLTLLWINTLVLSLYNEKLFVDKTKEFASNTSYSNNNNNNDDTKNKKPSLNLHCDTHLELLMPKLSISIYPTNIKETDLNGMKRQSGIEVGFARITLSNKTNVSDDSNLKSACSKVYNSVEELCNKQSKINQISADKLNQVNLNHLAPCFTELIKNENLSYFRIDFSSSDHANLVNTTNEAYNSKLGLFLKSLNRSSLNKNANKDVWCLNFESMWLDTFNSNDNQSLNESITLIQNVSFKLWFLNVHDFYNPLETPTNENSNSNTQTNGAIDTSENLNRALNRLSKVIKIDDIEVESKKRRSNSLSTALSFIKNQQEAYYLYRQAYSKLNVIGELNDLSLKCNHSQVIFFLRLLDTVDMFMNQLKIDSEHTLKYAKTTATENLPSKDKNNNRKQIDLLNFSDQEDLIRKPVDSMKSSIVNFSLIIKSVEIELTLNDHRKEINSDFLRKKVFKTSPRKLDLLTGDSTNAFNDDLQSETSNLNIIIRDPMKEDSLTTNADDFIELSRKLDQEFINGYLRYVYGFTNDNPNLRLSFSTVSSFLDESSHNNSNNDLINLARQVNKLPTNINNAVSVGFSAASSTLIAKKNSTISFFNKPTFNNIKSNIKQQFNPSQSSGPDYIETDLLSDDNDSYSNIIALDQDDTASLASFATDLSISYIQQQTSNSPKLSPTGQPSMSLSSSTSSISAAANSKIASISANLTETSQQQQQESEINNKEMAITTLANEESYKSYNDCQSQTQLATVFVKIKLNNIQTYVQVQDNSDMFAIVKLNEVKLRNMSSKFKNETGDILIRFKKIEDSLDCKDGLVEVVLDGFCFEIDIPTLTGLIDLIDDDDVGIPVKAQVMPANILVKNCQFNLNNEINETDEFLLDEKTVRLHIDSLLVNRSTTNEIILTEMNLNQTSKKVIHEVALDELEHIDTKLPKSDQLASLVYLLRKSREDNHNLKARLELEKLKLLEIEKESLKIKFENEDLQKRLVEMEKSKEDAATSKNENLSQLELERKQFESLLQSFQEENEQLRNKLKKSDETVAILNIERDCLMKKLNEQLKSNKK